MRNMLRVRRHCCYPEPARAAEYEQCPSCCLIRAKRLCRRAKTPRRENGPGRAGAGLHITTNSRLGPWGDPMPDACICSSPFQNKLPPAVLPCMHGRGSAPIAPGRFDPQSDVI